MYSLLSKKQKTKKGQIEIIFGPLKNTLCIAWNKGWGWTEFHLLINR